MKPTIHLAKAPNMDEITILRTMRGIRLTKFWQSDGTIKDYDEAGNFSLTTARVASIHELHGLLTQLAVKPDTCIIRGTFRGETVAQQSCPPQYPGHYRRRNVLFDDQPLHACMIDIDGFTPSDGVDPVKNPVPAIEQYIRSHLPDCFRGVSYHWQLSSGAGAARNAGLLKAHVWFWLATPHTSAQLKAWAKELGTVIDSSVFQRIQIHYTANPVFDPDVADPVPVRSGFVDGWVSDDVDLVLSRSALSAKPDAGTTDEIELKDPKEKRGIIGAFCRAFTMEQVIARWLSDVFEWQGDDNGRRLTYLKGGGAHGGAFVTPDREYVVNKHNTDPLDNRAANKFDLVRVHVFGHLDDDADVLDLAVVTSRPSFGAMVEMARGLEEVSSLLTQEEKLQQVDALNRWLGRIAECDDAHDLQAMAQNEISADDALSDIDKVQIVSALQNRSHDLVGIRLTRDIVVRWLKRKNAKGVNRGNGEREIEPWCSDYVWCIAEDCFVDRVTQADVSMMSFNAAHGRDVKGRWVTDEGAQMSASHVALQELQIPIVARRMYLPFADTFYEYDGQPYLNSYRPSSVPDSKPMEEWTDSDRAAIRVLQSHVETLIGEDAARVVLDWMAYCIQKPGDKIKWSVLIKGIEGDGKSYLGDVIRAVMGPANVNAVSPKVLNTDFNGWAEGGCVCLLEEIRMAGHNRHDVMNALKELHTNDTVTIHRKGRDNYQTLNTQNYLGFTNYVDALPLDGNDRRWYIQFSKFSNKDQLLEAGLNTEYFDNLFGLLQTSVGAMREFFLQRDINGFNAKGRAPDSDAKMQMIENGIKEEELIIREIIEQGITGVSKDVISTGHLSTYITLNYPDVDAPKGPALANLLSKLGYRRHKTTLWWGGANQRVWVKDAKKVNKPVEIRFLLDTSVKIEVGEDELNQDIPF